MHNRFSLPLLFPHNFYPLQHESLSTAAALQDEPASAEHELLVGCREQLLWSLEPPSWTLLHPFLFLTLLLSPSCVIYPFLNVFPQQHHPRGIDSSPGGLSSGTLNLLQRELEVAVTGTGLPLTSPCSLPTTKTPPDKPKMSVNVPVTLTLPCLGTCSFDVIQPFLQQHLKRRAKAPAFLIKLCQNQGKRVRKP